MEENQAQVQNQQPEEKPAKKTVFTREYYARIGRKGGQARVPKGFSANPKLASDWRKSLATIQQEPKERKER